MYPGSPRSPTEISKGESEEDKMDTTWVVDHNTTNNLNIDEKEFPGSHDNTIYSLQKHWKVHVESARRQKNQRKN